VLSLLAILVPLAVCGCGGSGELSAGRYSDAEASYHIGSLPDRWQRIDVGGQNDLAWRNGQLGAVIQVNASCDPSLDIPLLALTNHLLIGFTEREVLSQDLMPLASREALRTHVTAKLDGVPRELLLVVVKKDDCVYDFALVAPPGPDFAQAQSDLDGLLREFDTGAVP